MGWAVDLEGDPLVASTEREIDETGAAFDIRNRELGREELGFFQSEYLREEVDEIVFGLG
jgi:hypothetical protein